jgi:hypothetical protein
MYRDFARGLQDLETALIDAEFVEYVAFDPYHVVVLVWTRLFPLSEISMIME